MNFRPFLPASSVLALGLLAAPVAVHADTVMVNVSALVSDGCIFESHQAGSVARVNLGVIRPTSTGQVVAPPLSLRYRCTAGSTYRISFTSPLESLDITGSGSSTRFMSSGKLLQPKTLDGSGTTTTSTPSGGLPYTLAWTVPSQLTGEGTEIEAPTHEVSFSATVAAGAAAGLVPGLYQDSLTVTISPQ